MSSLGESSAGVQRQPGTGSAGVDAAADRLDGRRQASKRRRSARGVRRRRAAKLLLLQCCELRLQPVHLAVARHE